MGERRQLPMSRSAQKISLCTPRTTMKRVGQTTKAANYSTLVIDETLQWCNSFLLVPKANGELRICLDWAWLYKVLIRLIHKGPTHTDILPRLTGIEYLMFIDVHSGYHSLELDEQSSHLTAFHVILVVRGTYDCHLVLHWLEICFREIEMSCSRGYPICLALQMTFILQGLATWVEIMMLC